MKRTLAFRTTSLAFWLAVALAPRLAEAQNPNTWLPMTGSSANWNVSTNWSFGTVPSHSDAVKVDTPVTAWSTQGASVGSLSVGYNYDAIVEIDGQYNLGEVSLSNYQGGGISLGGSPDGTARTGTLRLTNSAQLEMADGELTLGPWTGPYRTSPNSVGVVDILEDQSGLEVEYPANCAVGRASTPGPGQQNVINQGGLSQRPGNLGQPTYPLSDIDNLLWIGGAPPELGYGPNDTGSGSFNLFSGQLYLGPDPGNTLYVGYAGSGVLTIGSSGAGGENLMSTLAIGGDLVVRKTAGASGLLQGSMGTPAPAPYTLDPAITGGNIIIFYEQGSLINNGVVRADGYGRGWTLDFSSAGSVDHDRTNVPTVPANPTAGTP